MCLSKASKSSGDRSARNTSRWVSRTSAAAGSNSLSCLPICATSALTASGSAGAAQETVRGIEALDRRHRRAIVGGCPGRRRRGGRGLRRRSIVEGERVEEDGGVDRLGHVVVHAGGETPVPLLDGGVRGHGDD